MKAKKELTQLEKIVLHFAIWENVDTWADLFKWSHPGKEYQSENSFNVFVSRWKNSELVRQFVDELKAVKRERMNRIKEEGRKEAEKERRREGEKATRSDTQIDFTDRDQFINYLNESVNKINDPKQKTDFLKMLSDLLRFKESTPDGSTEIQQFYTPFTCSSCPLMKMETEKNGV